MDRPYLLGLLSHSHPRSLPICQRHAAQDVTFRIDCVSQTRGSISLRLKHVALPQRELKTVRTKHNAKSKQCETATAGILNEATADGCRTRAL